MPQIPDGVERLFKKAVHCQVCFDNGWVSHSLVDIAQPRWIGAQYYSSRPRILIVLLNPGSGGEKRGADAELVRLLRGYRGGTCAIDQVFRHQAQDIENWGRRRFAEFYLRGLQLDLDRVALANIAWCASKGNSHPREVLAECWTRHTSTLVKLLSPEVVVLSGADVHRYRERMQELAPVSWIVPTLHYAHREGRAVESEELARVRRLIAEYPAKR